MKFTIFSILVTVMSSLSIFPQSRSIFPQLSTTKTETCDLDIKQSPSLRGVMLGMSPSTVSDRLKMEIPLKEGTSALSLTGRNAKSEIQYLLNENDLIAKTILVNLLEKNHFIQDKSISVADGSKIAAIIPTPEQKKTQTFEEITSIFLKYYDNRLIGISISYSTDKFESSTQEEFNKEIFSLLDLPLTVTSREYGFIFCAGFRASSMKLKNGLFITLEDAAISKSLEKNAIQSVMDLYENEKKRVSDLEREKAEKRGFKP